MTVLDREEQLRVVLRLTLLLLLTYPGGTPTLQIPIRVISGAMLLSPSLLAVPWLWAALAVAAAIRTADQWYVIDNHSFLISYWTAACALYVARDGALIRLAGIARVLVGLVFAFAVAWKIVAGQYVDGTFFYVTFFLDERLEKMAAVVSGWSLAYTHELRTAIGYLGSMGASGVALAIGGTATLKAVALAMAWGALLVEGLVALGHLVPGDRLYRLRHGSLMAFCLGTYYLMPVPGFAFILVILGFTQCHADDRRLRLGYLTLLAALQLMALPWQTLVARHLGAM